MNIVTAQQGMLFASLALEQSLKITLYLWKRGIFPSVLIEQGRSPPPPPPDNPWLFSIKL